MRKKRNIVIVISMLIFMFINAINVKAENNYITYNDIKYVVNTKSKTVTVCGYLGTGSDVEIPSRVYHNSAKGYIVSEIEDHAFDGCSTIRILTIPDTIMKVGDMSFIGMDNLQAVVSKTEGINIVVKDDVKIVSDRSELGNMDMDSDNASENTSESVSDNGSLSGSDSGNNTIEDVKAADSDGIIIDSNTGTIADTSNGNTQNKSNVDSGSGSGNNTIEDVKAEDSDGIIIESNTGAIVDASNGNIQNEGNVDSGSFDSTQNDVSGSNGVISGSDNKNNNTSEKTESNKNESASVNGQKSSSTKVVVSIICIVIIAGFAAGLFIYMKKKKR